MNPGWPLSTKAADNWWVSYLNMLVLHLRGKIMVSGKMLQIKSCISVDRAL